MIEASRPEPSVLDAQLKAQLERPAVEKPRLQRGDDIERRSLKDDLDDAIPW